jgi:hypothetical protein
MTNITNPRKMSSMGQPCTIAVTAGIFNLVAQTSSLLWKLAVPTPARTAAATVS